ncbi:hypothetical protein PILCRDRAFT_4301 [Piloderma croceum F 1598]|uniref:Uncharacterized protein n=1 Tax=Piloderma croceum (strain F 1598) TaxID=765440 RepID=A0A0C3G8V9_PILCF|nr:hypothetical protein PILCRDRAFT_4301 [Piloderma croceum F 1598]
MAEARRADTNNVVSSTRLSTPVDEDPQLHGEGLLKEIQDLQRQLQEEKHKNRLLNCGTAVQTLQTSEMIPKPKGSVGETGFSLIAAMKLDKQNPKDKTLYNDILACVRTLAIGAGIDLSCKYKDQSITKMAKLMLAAKEVEPYLAKFEDNWATGQILRQYINGKHKYEAAKARGTVNG